MNGPQTIGAAFGGAHMWFNGTVDGLTQEQANSVPPGVAHPIGVLIAHILHSEDFMVNTAIQGKPALWATDGWAAKLGEEMILEQHADTSRAYKCDLPALLAYGQTVFANTESFVANLKDQELDRVVPTKQMGFPEDMTVGVFLTTMIMANTYLHTGEISSLKGSLGMKGYAF